MTALPAAGFRRGQRIAWKGQQAASGMRSLAAERAVAMHYDGATYAVLLATPCDLDDFALGFSVTEGIVEHADEIEGLDVIDHAEGIELRMTLAPLRRERFKARQRRVAGPAGCGLCGITSLHEASKPALPVRAGAHFGASDITGALQALDNALPLGRETRAVHGAALWHPRHGLVAVREDVGRHNALDKLAGALAQQEAPGAARSREGIVLLTSRVSVELVQKTARIGASVMVAMSAPTTLAVHTAEHCGLTLVAVARGDGFEVFSHPQRVGLKS